MFTSKYLLSQVHVNPYANATILTIAWSLEAEYKKRLKEW